MWEAEEMNKFGKILSILILIFAEVNILAMVEEVGIDARLIENNAKITKNGIYKKYITDNINLLKKYYIPLTKTSEESATPTGGDSLNNWLALLSDSNAKPDLIKIQKSIEACFIGLMKLELFSIKANPMLQGYGLKMDALRQARRTIIDNIIALNNSKKFASINNAEVSQIVLDSLPDNIQEYIIAKELSNPQMPAFPDLDKILNIAKLDFYSNNCYIGHVFLTLNSILAINHINDIKPFARFVRALKLQKLYCLDQDDKFIIQIMIDAVYYKIATLIRKSQNIDKETKNFYMRDDKKSVNHLNIKRLDTIDRLMTIKDLLLKFDPAPQKYTNLLLDVSRMIGINWDGYTDTKGAHYVEDNTVIQLTDSQILKVCTNVTNAYNNLNTLHFLIKVFEQDLTEEQQKIIHLTILHDFILQISAWPIQEAKFHVYSKFKELVKKYTSQPEDEVGERDLKFKQNLDSDFVNFERQNTLLSYIYFDTIRKCNQLMDNNNEIPFWLKNDLFLLYIHIKKVQHAPFYSIVQKLTTEIINIIKYINTQKQEHTAAISSAVSPREKLDAEDELIAGPSK